MFSSRKTTIKSCLDIKAQFHEKSIYILGFNHWILVFHINMECLNIITPVFFRLGVFEIAIFSHIMTFQNKPLFGEWPKK